MITDVKIFGYPWREWAEDVWPLLRQTKQQLAVWCVGCLFFNVGSLLDGSHTPLWALGEWVFILALYVWIMFRCVYRTPKEQRQYDALIQRDSDEMVRRILEMTR